MCVLTHTHTELAVEAFYFPFLLTQRVRIDPDGIKPFPSHSPFSQPRPKSQQFFRSLSHFTHISINFRQLMNDTTDCLHWKNRADVALVFSHRLSRQIFNLNYSWSNVRTCAPFAKKKMFGSIYIKAEFIDPEIFVVAQKPPRNEGRTGGGSATCISNMALVVPERRRMANSTEYGGRGCKSRKNKNV